MRRYTRLTNAFSKCLDQHMAALALHMAYYNFVKIHSTVRMSPAMAAGIETRLWEMSDIVKLVEEYENAPAEHSYNESGDPSSASFKRR